MKKFGFISFVGLILGLLFLTSTYTKVDVDVSGHSNELYPVCAKITVKGYCRNPKLNLLYQRWALEQLTKEAFLISTSHFNAQKILQDRKEFEGFFLKTFKELDKNFVLTGGSISEYSTYKPEDGGKKIVYSSYSKDGVEYSEPHSF